MKFHESRVFRNFIFLFLNQFSNFIVPLLVFPFLIKTLGLEVFGLYSLTYASVLFGFMFCDYGFNFSGSKYIAIHRDEPEKQNAAFSNIIALKLIIAVFVCIIWIFFIFLSPLFRFHQTFGLLFIGMILGNAINVQWFFQGMEKLGWFSVVNSGIRLLANIAILLLVKSVADMYLIPLLYSISFLTSGIICILMAMKSYRLRPKIFQFKASIPFLRDGFDNFVTISTTSLVFNGTILILSLFEKSILIIGAFSALDRIVKILVAVYVPYSTAIYPRNMSNFHVSKFAGAKSVMFYGFFAIAFATASLTFIWLFADVILGYLDFRLVPFSNYLRIMSLWFLFIVINNLLGYHYLNGTNRSAIFRNVNTGCTLITVLLMLVGSSLYSFKGCIFAVLSGEIVLTVSLILVIHAYDRVLDISSIRNLIKRAN